jgi:hypothetical protein
MSFSTFFKLFKDFVSFTLAIVSILIFSYIFYVWFKNPELSYMQVFKIFFWEILVAIVCSCLSTFLKIDLDL